MGEIHGRLKRDILIETSPSVSPLIFVGNIYSFFRRVFLIYPYVATAYYGLTPTGIKVSTMFTVFIKTLLGTITEHR